MKIYLNDAEIAIAKYLAQERYKNNRNSNTDNRRIGPQSDEETDLNGIGGEIAFCKRANIYPDINTYRRPRQDAFIRPGIGVDIKTTKYENGKLVVASWKRNEPTNYYALVVGTFPNYRIVGVIAADEVFRSENIGDLGYGPCYVIDQDKLRG